MDFVICNDSRPRPQGVHRAGSSAMHARICSPAETSCAAPRRGRTSRSSCCGRSIRRVSALLFTFDNGASSLSTLDLALPPHGDRCAWLDSASAAVSASTDPPAAGIIEPVARTVDLPPSKLIDAMHRLRRLGGRSDERLAADLRIMVTAACRSACTRSRPARCTSKRLSAEWALGRPMARGRLIRDALDRRAPIPVITRSRRPGPARSRTTQAVLGLGDVAVFIWRFCYGVCARIRPDLMFSAPPPSCSTSPDATVDANAGTRPANRLSVGGRHE